MAQAKMRNENQNGREADLSADALVRDRLGREHRRRVRLERHRAMGLREGEAAPVPTRAEVQALVRADQLDVLSAVVGWVVPRRRGAAAIRAEACRMRLAVERAMAERAAAGLEAVTMKRTAELEAGREGVAVEDVVTVRRGEAQKRIRTRDGLKLLHERGGLTPVGADGRRRDDGAARMEADRLLAAGLRYRDRYEMAAASLKSGLNMDGGRREVGTIWAQAKAAENRVAKANPVRRLDMAVAAALGDEALYAIRMVAGEARSVRSLRSSRRPRQRLEAALVRALIVVGDCLAKGA